MDPMGKLPITDYKSETITLPESGSIPLRDPKSDNFGIINEINLECCNLHDGERKKFFCKNCQIFICASCLVLEHGKFGHAWTSAMEAAGQTQQELGEILLKAELKFEKVNVGISELEKKIEKVPLRMQALREDVTEACDDVVKNFMEYLQNKRLQLLERINILEKSSIAELEDSRKEGLEIQAHLARISELGKNVNIAENMDSFLQWKCSLEESLESVPEQDWCNHNIHVKVGALDPEFRFIKGSPGTSSHQCWCHFGDLVRPGRWQLVRIFQIDRPLGDLVTAIAALADGSVALGYQMNGVHIIDSAGNRRHFHQGIGHVLDIIHMKGNKLAILDTSGIVKVVQLPGGQMTVLDKNSNHFTCLSASEDGVLFAGSVSQNSIQVIQDNGSTHETMVTGITPLRISVTSDHIASLHHPASITIMDMAGQVKCIIHDDQWAYASVCSSGMGDFFILSANKSNPKSLRISQYAVHGRLVETVIDNYLISALGWLNPRMSASSGKLMVCAEDQLITFEREMLVLD